MLTSFDPRIHKHSASTKLSVTSDETRQVRKPQAAQKLMLKSRKAASYRGRTADPSQSLSCAVVPSWGRAPASQTPSASIPYLTGPFCSLATKAELAPCPAPLLLTWPPRCWLHEHGAVTWGGEALSSISLHDLIWQSSHHLLPLPQGARLA